MLKSCCLVECNNQPKDSNRTFHRFPSDITRRNNWIEITHIQNWTPNKYICSQHFLDSDFDKDGHRVRLRNNVVPSVNITHTNVPINKPVMIKEGVLQELLTSNAANSAANSNYSFRECQQKCGLMKKSKLKHELTLTPPQQPRPSEIKPFNDTSPMETKEIISNQNIHAQILMEHDYHTIPEVAKLRLELAKMRSKLMYYRRALKKAQGRLKSIEAHRGKRK